MTSPPALASRAVLDRMAAFVEAMRWTLSDPTSAELADIAIVARLRVTDALVAAGWSPPARATAALEADAALVGLPLGALEQRTIRLPDHRRPVG
jgi:hypothetical protein